MPAVNVGETADELILTAEIPGVNLDNVHLEVENNLLTISGEERDGTAPDILLPIATPMAIGAAALVVLLLLLAGRQAFRFESSRFVRLLEQFLGLIPATVGFPVVLVPSFRPPVCES